GVGGGAGGGAREGGSGGGGEGGAEPDYGLTALDYHDGAVYALERFWQTGIGNRIRILRFDAGALEAGGQAPIQPELLGTLEAGKAVDNFEGLAVLEHDGRTILLMVSDDNYNRAQRTLVLAFAVN
ncbi:esterase-like activity of phytase family protein, partial [uncultured Maricaulis sp.]|uniref:esterase-like activity of phytase family protein n=1 Tax=uncultured Maricaulis sp. TaxID=174710 RepID=UPI0030D77782